VEVIIIPNSCSRLSVAASSEIYSSRPSWLFLSCAGAGSCMRNKLSVNNIHFDGFVVVIS
jgi:hypothetical protein